MSIKNKTGQGHLSQAEGNHALELFTDRHEFSRLFAEYLNESPREKILFFHGDGGNGKSLLLKFLRQRCCKRFREDIWQQLKGKPDTELAAYIEESADSWVFTPIPAVAQDFGQKPIGDDQPQDPFYGLLMLRRNLADAQLAQHEPALNSYQEAIAAYNSALSLAPDFTYAFTNKGLALQSLGDLQADLSQNQDALKSWQAAMAAYTRSLKISPGDEYIRELRVRLQAKVNSLGEDSPTDEISSNGR